jgi:hypothetical protein
MMETIETGQCLLLLSTVYAQFLSLSSAWHMKIFVKPCSHEGIERKERLWPHKLMISNFYIQSKGFKAIIIWYKTLRGIALWQKCAEQLIDDFHINLLPDVQKDNITTELDLWTLPAATGK